MGWFKDLFKKKEPTGMMLADVSTGTSPIFSQYGDNIYASDVVQQAVSCIVREMQKLNPSHVRRNGQDITTVQDAVQRVLDNPNPLMTKSDFIGKITWNLMLNYNAFIYPTWYEYRDRISGKIIKNLLGLYPLQPKQVDFIQDESGVLYAKMRFGDGRDYIMPYESLIHIRSHYYSNDYMGGNAQGQPDNQALLQTLSINDKMLKGIAKAMEASYTVNGVVKYNTMMDGDKMSAAIAEFESKLNSMKSGYLPMDLKSDLIQFDRKIQMVDDATLEFIDKKILRTFGVSIAILSGDYTPAQYEAFYQAALEPLIIAMSQAFTKTLFTQMERSYGNGIEFYPQDLIFMSADQTIQMVNLLSNTGALYENEKRTAFGLKPLPELEGKRFMSLNWIDATKANSYQVGKENQDEE